MGTIISATNCVASATPTLPASKQHIPHLGLGSGQQEGAFTLAGAEELGFVARGQLAPFLEGLVEYGPGPDWW